MANANWSNPTLTSTYTNFLSEVKNRDEDLALQFDGTTSTNIPTNTIRWDSSAGRWKKWNGSSWAELTSTYALTGLSTTGNANIGGTLGVTGATTLSSTLGVTGAVTGSSTVSGTALIPTASTVPSNGLYLPAANTLGLATNSTGSVFLDSSGRLLVGTSTAFSTSAIQSSGIDSGIAIRTNSDGADFARYQAGSNGPFIFQRKSRNATIGSHTIVNNGDSLGGNEYSGSDGTNFIIGARIEAQVDGTPGANDMPGRLIFSTTADGASNPTVRMTIDSSGRLLVGTSTNLATNQSVKQEIANGNLFVSTFTNDAFANNVSILKSRSTGSLGTVVQNGDELGTINFFGDDGTSTAKTGAAIKVYVDGTPGNNDLPSRMSFWTTADGASSPTERMRIDSSGYLSGYTNGLGAGRIPAMQFYRLNSALVGANSTADQSVLGAGVTLVSSTVYAFEGLFIFTKSATGTTSHTISLGFGGTATINNILHMALSTALSNATGVGYDGTPSGYMANTAAYTVASGSASGAQSRSFIIRGSVSINAGGTFIPQYKLSAAPGSAYSTVAGSYFCIWPLGASGANTSIGTWA